METPRIGAANSGVHEGVWRPKAAIAEIPLKKAI